MSTMRRAFFGQDAGLINAVAPAAEIMEAMVSEADEIIRGRLVECVRT